jgi:signal transduction histidine kinase
VESEVELVVDARSHASGGPAPLEVDPDQLRQALLNLAKNALEALRAVEPPRRLELGLKAAERSLILTVSDNGPGIPSSIKARLFQPFATGKAHGTGLGLAVTRDIVRAHGGTIAIRSPLSGDRGTAVDITLPGTVGLCPSTARGTTVLRCIGRVDGILGDDIQHQTWGPERSQDRRRYHR